MSSTPLKIAILGRKIGMTRFFLEDGKNIPVTVIEAGPCVVTQVKTADRHGYSAVQIAFDDMKARNSTIPMIGHDAKAGSAPKRVHREIRVADDAAANGFQLGQTIDVSALEGTQYVDVVGTSKGKGTAGVMKRHNFQGVSASHGAHRNHRKPGSIGASSTPSRVFKGMRMAGRMGGDRVTVLNLTVHAVDAEKGLLLVKGAVPGARGRIVYVRNAVKGA